MLATEAVEPGEFEQHRAHLFGVAYRILGSAADAEDVVQEAFLRARGASEAEVRSPRAWLTTIATRLCLDEVRSARRRRENYVGPWLPEPVTTGMPDDEAAPSGDDRVSAAESVSMAFLVLLESLSPLERAVFVLREVFELDFPEIAAAVERSEAACRQLFHRAREHVAARRPRYAGSARRSRELAAAFLAALAAGDVGAFAGVLADDVVLATDHGGKASAIRRQLRGVSVVARWFLGMFKKARRLGVASEVAWVNGCPALVVRDDARLQSVTVLDTTSGSISAIHIVRNPDKLVAFERALAAGRTELPLAGSAPS
jgi:RNA polymerase sigma-70 factor (ECF subfamily)